MYTSLSRGTSRAARSYVCSSCLSNSSNQSNARLPQLAANRVLRTTSASFYTKPGNAQVKKKEGSDPSDEISNPPTKLERENRYRDLDDAVTSSAGGPEGDTLLEDGKGQSPQEQGGPGDYLAEGAHDTKSRAAGPPSQPTTKISHHITRKGKKKPESGSKKLLKLFDGEMERSELPTEQNEPTAGLNPNASKKKSVAKRTAVIAEQDDPPVRLKPQFSKISVAGSTVVAAEQDEPTVGLISKILRKGGVATTPSESGSSLRALIKVLATSKVISFDQALSLYNLLSKDGDSKLLERNYSIASELLSESQRLPNNNQSIKEAMQPTPNWEPRVAYRTPPRLTRRILSRGSLEDSRHRNTFERNPLRSRMGKLRAMERHLRMKPDPARPITSLPRSVLSYPNPKIGVSKISELKAKRGMVAHEIKTINAQTLRLVPVDIKHPPVPSLSYGLERVLFNPGVYQLQDPRSRVFNFDPYLQTIMPVNEFDFTLLKRFITSSKDETLLDVTRQQKKKYTGSTSSMTSTLSHFHYLISQWRPINTELLSQKFPASYNSFTALQRGPTAMFLRWKDGIYAIDADKEYDTANVLSMLGQSMEKLLTLSTEEFERYRKNSTSPISEEARKESEAYHYTTMGDFLMRSQLDAHDPRVPGTGMFDLKTRAVVSIRMDTDEYEQGRGYEIRSRYGEWESFEREYYDMIRAAFLKYSMQVRIGRMDGIFVAFHNTERIFGFQYISLPEMDHAIHGTDDTTLGDSEFKLSLDLLNRVLDRATAKFPEQSLRLFFETRSTTSGATYMYIFAEPTKEEDIEQIQSSNKATIEEFENRVLGMHRETEEEKLAEWKTLQNKVQESMEKDTYDEANVESSEAAQEPSDGEAPAPRVFDEDEDSDGVQRVDEETGKLSGDRAEIYAADEAIEKGAGDHNSPDMSTRNEADTEELDDVEGQESEANPTPEPPSDSFESGNEDLVEDNSQAKEPIAGQDNAEFSDAIAAEISRDTPNPPGLLAMYLTIRNKVNGQYVVRPDKLAAEDKWNVEYSLSEISDSFQARKLYQGCKRRRGVTLAKSSADKDNAWNRKYIENIRKLSNQGRDWRKHLDAMDSKGPRKVAYGEPLQYTKEETWTEDGHQQQEKSGGK